MSGNQGIQKLIIEKFAFKLVPKELSTHRWPQFEMCLSKNRGLGYLRGIKSYTGLSQRKSNCRVVGVIVGCHCHPIFKALHGMIFRK